MAVISISEFKGQRSWVLRNDAVEVVLLPNLGAKMASLVHRRTGRELLYQRADWPVLPQPPYGASFGDYDLSGFDEMFPTIDACRYTGGVWDGTLLPDHGEVWAVPWQCEAVDDTLVASVHGWRLPYRLEKRLALVGASAVRTDYTATNLAGEALHVLWAAHPLCACTEATRIVLPPGTTRVVNTFPGSARFAGYGAYGDWPEMTTTDGGRSRLDVIGPSSLGRADKYWVDGRVAAGWAALHHTDTGEALGFAWTADTVPYLGIWVTEGGYGGHYHAALEPATAAMDRPDVAARYGRASVLPAYGRLTWSLTLAIGQVGTVRGVTLDGTVLA
ncbi:MAG: hypothetical protein IT340_23155 [Chloroflexi bacterium]|nr:hypothetical protein [Chloroflexota bacterium]